MKNRLGRIIIAVVFLIGFAFYTYDQEKMSTHSDDIAHWGEAGGLKEGFVDASPVSENCAAGTDKAIAAVKELIVSGEWDVFSGVKLSVDNEGNIVKTDAPLMDNAGNEIVAAGGPSVEDSVITGTMNYLVAGVEKA